MPGLVQTTSRSVADPARRSFIGRAGLLSAAAVALLAGRESMAQGMAGDPTQDVAILNVALGLKHEAINAYLGVIPAFGSKDQGKVAARLAADETMHFTVLTDALGRPLPMGALSFGA